MGPIKNECPLYIPQKVCWCLAVAAQLALCLYHRVKGYTRPGTNPESDPAAAVAYNHSIVGNWLAKLEEYRSAALDLKGLTVLELGPGPDPGAGMLFLASGAAHYSAIDVNQLFQQAGDSFYSAMIESLKGRVSSDVLMALKDEVAAFRMGKTSKIEYYCEPNFDLSVIGSPRFDLVVSQAAFEHFCDPATTIAQLSELVRPGGLAAIQIDLMTHTPRLRDWDPLSIYRVPNWIYRAASYPGVPNRIRPEQYKEMFESAGWKDLQIYATKRVCEEYLDCCRAALAADFRGSEYDMSTLSMYLCAVRS